MDMLLLEEDSCIDDLRPFTWTRSVLDIRMGIFTLREKWEMILGKDAFELTSNGAGVTLPANVLPTIELAGAIYSETIGEPLTQGVANDIIGQARIIRYPWDIF